MSESTSSSESSGIHYFQAAQRLGISVQHLMQMERTGAVDPPRSLERGRGRYYTNEELEAIRQHLAIEADPPEGIRARPLWLATAGAFLIALVFVMTRGAPPRKPPANPRHAAAQTQGDSRRAGPEPVQLERDDSEGGPDADQAGPMFPRLPSPAPAPERSAEQKAEDERIGEQIEQLQKRGIFY